MIALLIVAALLATPYAIYRACRKWGVAFGWFFAAGVACLGWTGVVAEKLFGPYWSWNFAHHSMGWAIVTFVEGILFFCFGLRNRLDRQVTSRPTLPR